MRSFVVLLIAALLATTVASGLMAFLLPFDIGVTRVHATIAPLLTIFVVWHLVHNRRSLFAYLGKKHRWSILAVVGCLSLMATLLYFNTAPINVWMNQSYESRRAEVIFRPSEEVVTRHINGRIDVKHLNETVAVLLSADLAGGENAPPNHVVIWLEDDQGKLLETLYLSEELAFREKVDDKSRYQLLPVWWHRWQKQKEQASEPNDDVDAITGPTATAPFDFATMIDSQHPSFNLMIEITRADSISQIYSAMVELDRFKRHYLADLSGLGSADGMLSYDMSSLNKNDLLVDKAFVTIDDKRKMEP